MPENCNIVLAFFVFLWRCFHDGISFTWDTFGFFDIALAIVEGALLWGTHRHREKWEKWEPKMRKYLVLAIAAQLIFGVCFVAPFLKTQEAENSLNDKELANSKLQAQLDDRSPKLDGFFHRSFISNEPGTTNNLIFVEVSIDNYGGTPTYADVYELTSALPKNSSFKGIPLDFEDEYKLNFTHNSKPWLLDLKRRQLISEKTINSINPGETKRGWLAFRIKGVPFGEIQPTNLILSFLDINGKIKSATNGFWKGKFSAPEPLDDLTMAEPGSENIFYPNDPPPRTNWDAPELPPGCSNVVIYFGSLPENFPRQVAEADADGGANFPIKELPDYFLADFDKSPYYSPRIRNIWIRTQSALLFNGLSTPEPILPVVVSNRLYIEVEIPFSNEKRRLVMSDAFGANLPIPRKWDINFSTNYDEFGNGVYAYEIVNELTNPVLQVIYYSANIILVNGIFQVGPNIIYSAFGDQPAFHTLVLGGINTNQSVTTASLQVDNFHETFVMQSNETMASFGERFTNELFRPIFKNQKPMFKYPSSKYLGVFANPHFGNNKSDTNSIDKSQ